MESLHESVDLPAINVRLHHMASQVWLRMQEEDWEQFLVLQKLSDAAPDRSHGWFPRSLRALRDDPDPAPPPAEGYGWQRHSSFFGVLDVRATFRQWHWHHKLASTHRERVSCLVYTSTAPPRPCTILTPHGGERQVFTCACECNHLTTLTTQPSLSSGHLFRCLTAWCSTPQSITVFDPGYSGATSPEGERLTFHEQRKTQQEEAKTANTEKQKQ
ncbi:hypothetical protein GWK47_024249 [Chionoecetes opilio]|uniref:Uncharacterized protein n=1 Tax=Chionoecetes opilio TaxID=41210 RepID=A0A8J4XVJ9_CHIOP|nr:hypothetical protein GWK47_024249 [Chionoecetes opilio]